MISVIVPVYNVEFYLKKCLDSLLNQTYSDIEIICIDDGSTDNSGAILDEFSANHPQIRVVHKSNGGVSSARNVGLQLANGEYIGFVDADDCCHPDMYFLLFSLCEQNKADAAICSITFDQYEYSSDIESFSGIEALVSTHNGVLRPVAGLCSKLIRKASIPDLFLDENVFIAEDLLFWDSACVNFSKVVFSKSKYYYYRSNTDSATHKSRYSPKYLSSYQAMEKVRDLFHSFAPEFSKIGDRELFYCNYCIISRIIGSSNAQDFKDDIKRHLRLFRHDFAFSFLSFYCKREKIKMLCLYLNLYLYKIVNKLI